MPEVITDVKTVGTSVTGAPAPPPSAWIIAGAIMALASAIGAVFLIKKRRK